MRKFVYIAVIALGCIFQTDSFAVQYGDLYGVEWCPCNPDDQYDQNGSVVLGKTVMCPCDSMYEGYDRTMEKDLRKVQHKVKQKVEQAKNFKYYVGFDYNKSQMETSAEKIGFNNLVFSPTNGFEVPFRCDFHLRKRERQSAAHSVQLVDGVLYPLSAVCAVQICDFILLGNGCSHGQTP